MFVKANNNFLTEIPATGGSLREGIIGLPRTINPVLAITDVDKDISSLVYSGLMKYSNGQFIPDIAKSYSVSENGLTYTFILRDDVNFQDGTPLTTNDIVFTIQKIQEITLKSPRRPDWTNVTINRISDYEIQFILKQPYAPFLTNTTIGIIPKHIWGKLTDNEFIFSSYNMEPIGSGPYKINSVNKDSESIPTEISLTTWNKYYGEKPFIKNINFIFYADENKVIEALKNNEIDSIPAISAQSAAKISPDQNSAYKIVSQPLPRIFGVFFNQNQNSVLADKVVRHALDLAIDRQNIVDSVLFGYGIPITGPIPTIESIKPLEKKDSLATTSSQIIEAMNYIENNGWKKNQAGIYEKNTKGSSQKLSFTLYTADTPDLKQTADILKNYWGQFGAEVEVKIFESNDLYQNIIRPRKYDALLFGEHIGKDRDLYAFWHSSQRNAPGLNVAMYTNSKTDALLESIRTTSDSKNQMEKYNELANIIKQDLPAIFIYSPNFIYAIPKTLHDINLGIITTPSDRWNSVESWYIVTEKVWKWFASK